MGHNRRLWSAVATLLAVITAILVSASGTWAAGKYKTLHKFTGQSDGVAPHAGLVFDQAGNLYGTTVRGGTHCCGTIFELTPNSHGSWEETVLHNFTGGNDGGGPYAGVIFDQEGSLYGTTTGGGTHIYGTVFKLTPESDGSWKEKVLHNFTGGNDGEQPQAGLIFDQAGNLYGTTVLGGAFGAGTAFKLTPKPDGSWTESVLYSFCAVVDCRDGLYPSASLIFDKAGNLYGTTEAGGVFYSGTAFKLTPNQDGSWEHKVLHNFTRGKDGEAPLAGVIFDQAGNLFGTTSEGGSYGAGVVFELTPKPDGSWTEKTLQAFSGRKGIQPWASLIFDRSGNLYGTTSEGGSPNHCPVSCGVVFKLARNSSGRWKETVLHTFVDNPGADATDSLLLDQAGNLYGTTNGYSFSGSVFEIMP
jgi:uncharacterized repeat protein (TIGR03803 family)